MNKPIKPNITIPESFAENGIKTDFDSNKLTNGFNQLQPDILAGDNLNKFIDDSYKGLNYSMAGTDAINLIQEGETLTVKNGELISTKINAENFPIFCVNSSAVDNNGQANILKIEDVQNTEIAWVQPTPADNNELVVSGNGDYTKVFDGNGETDIFTQDSFKYMQMKTKKAIKATNMQIRNANYSVGDWITSGYIEASNDGNNWVRLKDFTSSLGAAQWVTVPLNSTQFYTYHRLVCTAHTGNGWMISELKLNGVYMSLILLGKQIIVQPHTATTGQGKTYTKNNILLSPDVTEYVNGTYIVLSNPNDDNIALRKNTIYRQHAQPTSVNGDFWLNTSVQPYTAYEKVNGIWEITEWTPLGECVINNGFITSVKSYMYNFNGIGREMMARMGKPSNKYINLTLLASGSNYVAPDDGYFSLRKMSTNSNQYINLVTDNLHTEQMSNFANQQLKIYIPVQKGHAVYSGYNAGGELLDFKFVYAEGAK